MFRNRNFSRRRAGVPLALLLLAGCASVPDLGTRPAPRAAGSVASARVLGAPSADAAWPGGRWWTQFGDPQLDSLIEEGLRSAPDMALAAARFRKVSALAGEARAATLPSLSGEASVYETRQSLNLGFPDAFKSFLPQGWNDGGEVAGRFAFDLDLWGRNRAALAAATSQARAAEVDAAQAALVLSTGIASAYFDLALLHRQRDVQQAALDVRQASRDLVARRMANGLETRGSLRQAEAQLASARADLVAADLRLALRRNQIAALVGAGPDRGLAIARPALAPGPVGGLPDGVTTALVARRPDIVAARERVEAAGQGIVVARADFYPAIRLQALIGFQVLGLGQLFDRQSTFGQAGPALTLPIFDGGALRGRYRGARADYDAAVAGYDQTVVQAYRQVADAVTGRAQVARILAEARAAQDASEEAYTIARLRYDGGLSNYLDVLDVEDRLLQARLKVANLEADVRLYDLALIQALGGGFGAENKDDADG